jgi:hypothetical protein
LILSPGASLIANDIRVSPTSSDRRGLLMINNNASLIGFTDIRTNMPTIFVETSDIIINNGQVSGNGIMVPQPIQLGSNVTLQINDITQVRCRCMCHIQHRHTLRVRSIIHGFMRSTNRDSGLRVVRPSMVFSYQHPQDLKMSRSTSI